MIYDDYERDYRGYEAALQHNLAELESQYKTHREYLERYNQQKSGWPQERVEPEAMVGSNGQPVLAPLLIAIMQAQAVLAQLGIDPPRS